MKRYKSVFNEPMVNNNDDDEQPPNKRSRTDSIFLDERTASNYFCAMYVVYICYIYYIMANGVNPHK